jgi:hypothetical protein
VAVYGGQHQRRCGRSCSFGLFASLS